MIYIYDISRLRVKVTCVLKKPAAYTFVARRRGKGKATPLEAWTGPEGSRRMRLPDFKTIGT